MPSNVARAREASTPGTESTLQTANCNVQTANCRLQHADCRLWTATCNVRLALPNAFESQMWLTGAFLRPCDSAASTQGSLAARAPQRPTTTTATVQRSTRAIQRRARSGTEVSQTHDRVVVQSARRGLRLAPGGSAVAARRVVPPRASVSGVQLASCILHLAVCSLQFAVCSLQLAVCSL